MAGKSHKELSPIYVSLAITYFDLKCPADAINCYMEELEIMEDDNYKEVSHKIMRNITAAFSLLTAEPFVCLDDNVKVVVPLYKHLSQ